MAHIPHALSLPEVAFRVVQYLELDDFIACSLVCKSFYASYAPYAWENVHLGIFSAYEKKRAQNQEPLARFISPGTDSLVLFQRKREPLQQGEIPRFFQRVAPWIRSLSIYAAYFSCKVMLGDQCNNLHSLLLSLPTFTMPSEETCWNASEALFRQNSNSLRSLTLMEWHECFDDPLRPIWSPLHTCAQHINLTTLRIQHGKLHEQDLEAFWTICQQLEILELTAMDMMVLLVPSNESSTEGVHHENRPSLSTTPAAVRFPKLRELTLDGIVLNAQDQMEFILQCPMLHALFWRLREHMVLLDAFCGYFEAQNWPYLDSLEIIGEHTHATSDHRLRLLQSTKCPFKRLELHISTMDQRSFDLLREGGHFGTLTKVDLSVLFLVLDHQGMFAIDTEVAASKRIREILESCPSLEHIAGTVISGQDIIDSKSWACRRLKKFEVLVSMDLTEQSTTWAEWTKDEKRRCNLVFERLSQLRQLKVLNMKSPTMARYRCETLGALPLDLRMGLGRLSTLTDLEWIGYEGDQRMRMVDVEWMLQHWRKLCKITGGRPSTKLSKTFGNTNVRCYLFRKTLLARKVEVPMEWWAFGKGVKDYMGKNRLKTVYDTDDDSEG